MSMRVVRAGLLTSVQDLGRYGLQHLGIVPGGAMDVVAHRIANALVGNPASAATLECTVSACHVPAGSDAVVSVSAVPVLAFSLMVLVMLILLDI